MGFLMNSWYAAAWSHEVVDGLFARRLLNLSTVMFRNEQGEVAALLVRGMPTSAKLNDVLVETTFAAKCTTTSDRLP